MKKSYGILLIGIITILFSCEVDDICLEPTTPQLIIRFYDVSNPTVKKQVSSLNVWVDGRDSVIKNKATDSIAIPLRTDLDHTTYKFSSSDLVDEITINYQRSEVYISRSCGYKSIFLDINITQSSTNWIQQLIITNLSIENEKSAHINILH